MKLAPLVFLIGLLLTALSLTSSSWREATADEDSTVAARREWPPGDLGRVVRLGRDIVENTAEHPLSKPYVGNALTCSSCHLDAGTHPKAATFIGVATAYPAWSPREKRVVTLEDRSLNCFMRSMNGVRPPKGSEVSVAVTAYITWLSTGMPLTMNHERPLGPNHIRPLKIDPAKANVKLGEQIYKDACASCHGKSGQGTKEGPPVWGPKSYNTGAGLSENHHLANWLKVAMPLDDTSLSDQESLDVAAYINSHPRPKFVLQEHLPPPERLGEYNADSPPKDQD